MFPSSLRRRICWARKILDDQQDVSGEVDGESMLELKVLTTTDRVATSINTYVIAY